MAHLRETASCGTAGDRQDREVCTGAHVLARTRVFDSGEMSRAQVHPHRTRWLRPLIGRSQSAPLRNPTPVSFWVSASSARGRDCLCTVGYPCFPPRRTDLYISHG